MRIKVNEQIQGVNVLPAILRSLPDGLSAWVSHGQVSIFDGDVEIAQIPVAGLSPEEAVAEVSSALKGVV